MYAGIGWKQQKALCDARRGAQVAGLPGSGSGSAVFLIHADGLRAAGAAHRVTSAARPSSKTGCYHSGSVNVL